MRIEPPIRLRHGLRLAPLVDVVFLLLVFFMLVARMEAPQTITVENPTKSGGGNLQGAILIRLGPDGNLDLNAVAIDIEDLPSEIVPFLARNPEPPILVQPAYDAPLHALVQVLDHLKTAGAEDLRLVEP